MTLTVLVFVAMFALCSVIIEWSLVFKTLQFLNHCMSRISRIKQQKLAETELLFYGGASTQSLLAPECG